MLDGLAAVDWSKLSHAYGPADDLPELLREAAATDEERRDEAVHDLFGTVWHQGTVYSATPHAVPFVAELAEHGPGHRGDMLLLLACIVEGSSVCGGDPEAVEPGRQAVFGLLPRLLALFDDEDPTVRRGLLRLIAACGDDGLVALPLLKARLDSATDAAVRAGLVPVLAITDPSAEDRDKRNRRLMADPAPAVRLAAATEVLRTTATPYPTSLVAHIVDAYVAEQPEAGEFGFGDRKSLEDLLVDDPEAALFATTRAAAAGSDWSLAWGVHDEWRDREADVLPCYFRALEQPQEPLRRQNELYRIARAAAAVPALDAACEERLVRFAADPDAAIRAAALTALARGQSRAAVAGIVRLIENDAREYGTGLAVEAAAESLGSYADDIALAVVERLRSPSRRPVHTSNQEISLLLALTNFPDIAATVVDELAVLVEHGPCPNAAALVLRSLGRRAESAAAVLSMAAQDHEDFGLAYVAGTAHFQATGSPDVALDVFRRGLAGRHRTHALGLVGELGPVAVPLLPILETGLGAESAAARAGAAESIWRISGRMEDTLPVIAERALTSDGTYATADAEALRTLTDMRAIPEALLPDLRAFADAKRRRVFDGSYDGTPHDDNVARAAVRGLLEVAVAVAIPLPRAGTAADTPH